MVVEGLLEACGEDSREGEVRETIHLCTRGRIAKSLRWRQAFHSRLDHPVAVAQRGARDFLFLRAATAGTCVDGVLGSLSVLVLFAPLCCPLSLLSRISNDTLYE